MRLVDAAFRFALCHPAVVSVIPGGQGLAEMESNLAARNIALREWMINGMSSSFPSSTKARKASI